jgi:Holliday junction resolvasome RuvABC endonuclease subunit
MNIRHILTVDPSLACSGWALFRLLDGALLAVGSVKSLGPEHPLAVRFRVLQERVGALYERCQLGDTDLVVCEMQTTMRDPHAAHKVEQVRGIFEVLGRARGAQVPGRINPRTVQFEAMGMRGCQLDRATVKAQAVYTASALYGDALKKIGFNSSTQNLSKNQDIVDALLLGTVAIARIKTAVQGSHDILGLFESNSRRTRAGVLKRTQRASRQPKIRTE